MQLKAVAPGEEAMRSSVPAVKQTEQLTLHTYTVTSPLFDFKGNYMFV